ncbi:unnamed protein product [Aureobasidium vineae]|uniref:Uncharacterized protein n=1 Tax=Aureobasidium vineae TaxID=2773715 RepID=A0A9N8P666_9PEZI|nr:unnamed protein product [Aureobasidium vineae]
MPTLLPRSTAPKSIFDVDDNNQGQPQANASTSSTQTHNDPYASTRKPELDPEVSSVFTQSTIGPSESIHQGQQPSSSRFNFLKRNKSKSEQQQEASLLPNNSDGANTEAKEGKKKSRFENPFKPHVQTDEDRAIMERMRERLGSREEAIRQGGAQPAGYRGYGGGQAMGGAWTGGM